MIHKCLPVFLIIMSFLSGVLFAEDIDIGLISGQMLIKDGGHMSNGMVVFFKAEEGPVPDPNRYLRIPDEVADLDEEGRFRVALPAGKYFMGSIKRMSGELIGPPQDGDYFFISQDSEGLPFVYAIEKDKNLNIGIIAEATPFKRVIPEDATGITGIIRDLSSNPVEGAIVFAYFTETMTGLPPFTSYRTGKDGKYFISVSHSGKYYLRVRDVYGGGPPVAGALMGAYGEEKPAAVTIKTGEITEGIDIKVVRHLERGPKGQNVGLGINKNVQEELKKKMKEQVEKSGQKK
jgi:hypothetical protein